MPDDSCELKAIFRSELGDDSLDLAPETRLTEIAGWDSVNMACVILAVEKRFGFIFEPLEMDRMRTFGDFLAMIDQKAVRTLTRGGAGGPC